MPDRHSTGNPHRGAVFGVLSAAFQIPAALNDPSGSKRSSTCASLVLRDVFKCWYPSVQRIQVSVQDVLASGFQSSFPASCSIFKFRSRGVHPSVWLQPWGNTRFIEPRASQPCKPLLRRLWGTKHQTWVNAEISYYIKTDRSLTKGTDFASVLLSLAGQSWKRQHSDEPEFSTFPAPGATFVVLQEMWR